VIAFALGALNLDADPANATDDATSIEQFNMVSVWVYGKPATELTPEERQAIIDTMAGHKPLPSEPHREPCSDGAKNSEGRPVWVTSFESSSKAIT
jgi:hypothetical protein